MRRRCSSLLQVAVILLLPGTLAAQHAGSGGAVSSTLRGAPGSPSSSFSAPRRSFEPPSGPTFAVNSGKTGHPGHWPSGGQVRHPDDGRRGGYRYPIVYGGYPGLAPLGYGVPWGLAYGDEPDEASAPQPAPQQADNGAQAVNDYAPDGSGPQIAATAPPTFRPEYQREVVFAPVTPQPATILIFKDGRKPMQVHNYALTGTTLYALDGETRQEIPLSLLNVPATVEANRVSGVDFALPVAR